MDFHGSLCPHGHARPRRGVNGEGHMLWCPTAWVRILALAFNCGNLNCLIPMKLSFLICEKVNTTTLQGYGED